MSPVSPLASTVEVQDQEEITVPDDGALCAQLLNSETLKQISELLVHLPEDKRAELINLIQNFPSPFLGTPTHSSDQM